MIDHTRTVHDKTFARQVEVWNWENFGYVFGGLVRGVEFRQFHFCFRCSSFRPVLIIVYYLSQDDTFIIPACLEQRNAAIACKIGLSCDRSPLLTIICGVGSALLHAMKCTALRLEDTIARPWFSEEGYRSLKNDYLITPASLLIKSLY